MGRKLFLNILLIVFIVKILIWILRMFNLVGGDTEVGGAFYISLFENLNRGFILLIPFLLLLLKAVGKSKALYLLLSLSFFALNSYCYVSDTLLKQNETATDGLIIFSYLIFCVPTFIHYFKTKEKVMWNHAWLAWSVSLFLYGLADFTSTSRVEIKTISDYTLIFLGITYIAQYLIDRSKI